MIEYRQFGNQTILKDGHTMFTSDVIKELRRIADLEKKIQDIELLNDKLKHAYCGIIGSDSIVGLDSCDDYKEWLESLDN